jgi:transcriptional regulator GlxA family with amidase domain
MPCRVVIFVSDGFTDSGVGIALDVLRTANALFARAAKPPPFRIDVASACGGPVRAASGMVFESTAKAIQASRADVVMVPGIWVEDAREVDALFEREDIQTAVRVTRAAHKRGALVCSSCGGAFILAEAGILDARACTTTWWLAPHLLKRRPEAEVNAKSALVIDGRVVTAGAVFAQADLSLYLVSRFAGPTAARHCARLLLLDTHPSQAPYMAIHQLSSNDKSVRRAEAWVRANLSNDFDIPTLAKTIGVSTRTLARRLSRAVGVSPIGFVQRLRVETAVHLLETTRMSLQEIGIRVGYSDTNALRRLIQRETQTSPREIRRRALTDGATPPRTPSLA